MSVRCFRAVLFACVWPGMAVAQWSSDSIAYDAGAERSFVAAMRMFQAGLYDSSATLFLQNLKDFPRSHRTTGAYIMGGKALYASHRHRESIRLLKDLIDLFPSSAYVDDAQYSLGLSFFRMLRYEDAANEFLAARESTNDTTLARRSEQMLSELATEHLLGGQLDAVRTAAKDTAVIVLLALRRAQQLQSAGDQRSAVDVLKSVAGFPDSAGHVTEARTMLAQLEAGRTMKIGAILPLMLASDRPGTRELGIEFLEGIRFAVDDFNRRSPVKVTLDARDSERDPSAAARVTSSLCGDENVVAIVGPISSNEAFAAAGIANACGVPMLTPTATSNGISAIGPFVFQGNPDYDIRGRAVAAYAWKTLGARRFAVLAPTDAVGKLMADGFVEEVRQRQGDMVAVQWYYSGATDLRSQLQEMRRTALKKKEVPVVNFAKNIRHQDVVAMSMAGASQKTLDSLMEIGGAMSVDSLFGPSGRQIADSLRLPVEIPTIPYDSLEIVVDSIDVIFVPIASSEEIAVASSQIKFYNFTARILGTGDWNDPAELDRNRRYADGVIFLVDAYLQPKDSRFQSFVARYQAATKRPPTVNALFGFDAADLLLRVIEKGATLRTEIAEGLSQVRGYKGLHSTISFSPQRVNAALTVLRYGRGSIVHEGEIDLTVPDETSDSSQPE